MALLARVNRRNPNFSVCWIPVMELAANSSSNTIYAEVDKMTKSMAAHVLHIERYSGRMVNASSNLTE